MGPGSQGGNRIAAFPGGKARQDRLPAIWGGLTFPMAPGAWRSGGGHSRCCARRDANRRCGSPRAAGSPCRICTRRRVGRRRISKQSKSLTWDSPLRNIILHGAHAVKSSALGSCPSPLYTPCGCEIIKMKRKTPTPHRHAVSIDLENSSWELLVRASRLGRGEIKERVRDAIVAVRAENDESAVFWLRAEAATLVHRNAGRLAEDEFLANGAFGFLFAEGCF